MAKKKESATPSQWEAMRSACVEGGMTFTEASNHYSVNLETIRSRAKREDWQTASVMRAKAQRALREVKQEEDEQLKAAIRLDRVDLVRKKEEHRMQMMQACDDIMTTTADNGFEHLKIRGIRDLEVLDAMVRRNLGMDIEDQAAGKLMTLDFSGVKPATVEEKKASPPIDDEDFVDI